MTSETLISAIGNIDDTLLDRAARKRAAVRRPVWRYAVAAAAAVLLIFGAVFAAVKLFPVVGESPKDAVLPPVQWGKHGGSDTSYEKGFNFLTACEDSEAICRVRIGNWLGDNGTGTYYEAAVEKTYKGELPDKINIYQIGNQDWNLECSPLFTYGDELILFLIPWHCAEGYDDGFDLPDCYELVGADQTDLYIFRADNGDEYLFDNKSILSYMSYEECPEIRFNNYTDDAELISELYKNMEPVDPAIAYNLIHHSEILWSEELAQRYVYSLEEFESFLMAR